MIFFTWYFTCSGFAYAWYDGCSKIFQVKYTSETRKRRKGEIKKRVQTCSEPGRRNKHREDRI
jgi:hypothetical protein